MTDIASLGFEIDTAPLTRANTELKNLITLADKAERAVAQLGTTSAAAFTRTAANTNSLQVAMRAVAQNAGNAAQAVANASTSMTANTNATTVATRAAATANNAAVAAQNAAAASAVNHAGAHQRLAANTNATSSVMSGFTGTLRTAGAGLTAVDSSVMGLGKAFGLLSTILAGSAIIDAINKYTQLTNTLRMTGVVGNDAAIVQQRLFDIADKSGIPIGEVIKLYQRQSIAAHELGASQLDMLKIIDVVAAALRIQGTSTEGARGALLQLSQSFETGVVHSQEFNSILQNAYPLAQAAARGIEGMGGSVAKLQNAVKSGQITSKQFFDGILKGGAQTVAISQEMDLQLSGAFTNLSNSFIEMIGRMDTATGFSKDVVKWINAISTALSDLSKNESVLDVMKDAWNYIRDYVKRSVDEFWAVLNVIQKIYALAKGIAQEVGNAVGMASTGEQMKDSAIAVAKETAELEKRKRVLETMNGNLDRNPTGAALKNWADQTAAVKQQEEVLQQVLGTQKAIVDERMKLMVPNAAVPKGIDGSEFWQGPQNSKLGDKSPATAIEAVNKKAIESYRKIIQSGEDFIALKKVETQALGLNAAQTSAMTHEQELLNKAAMANVPLTIAQKNAIHELALRMGEADAAYKNATFVHNAQEDATTFITAQAAERDALFMSREAAAAYTKEVELNSAARAKGLVLTEPQKASLHAIAVATAAAAEETKNYSDALQLVKDVGKSALEGIFQALIKGESIWQSFANAAKKALDQIISKLSEVAINSLFDGGASANGLGAGITGVINKLIGSSSAGSAGTGISTGGGGLSGLVSSVGSGLSDMMSTTSDWFGNLFSSQKSYSSITSLLDSTGGIGGTGISGLGALGAGVGGIMGVMQLLKGGTKNTIGGIGSIVGAGVSLIPGIGQIAGPIIGILSNVLPGLLGIGEDNPKITNQAYGELSYGGKGFGTSGGAWGPTANASSLQGPLGQIGQSMSAIFQALGGVKDAAKVWGVAMQTFSQKQGDKTFQNQTSFVVGPDGQKTQWGQGDNAAIGNAAANAAINSILTGAVGDISENMRKALGPLQNPDLTALGAVVSEILNFDKVVGGLGKTVTTSQQALEAIDAQFQGLLDTANKYGLDTTQVDSAKVTARQKVASDFANGLQRSLNEFNDPSKNKYDDLDAQIKAMKEENDYLVANVAGTQSQIVKIEQYATLQRLKIAQEFASAVDAIDVNAVKRNYYDMAIATKPTENQETYKYYQSLQDLSDKFSVFYKNAADLGLTVDQIGKDYLDQFKKLGEDHQKAMDALAYAKFQFFDDIAAKTKAVNDPFGASLDDFARQRNATIKAAYDQWGQNSPEAYQAVIASYGLFNAQMKAANDNFIKTMNDAYDALRNPAAANAARVWEARMADIAKAVSLDGPGFDGILRQGPAVAAAMRKWNEEIFKAARDMQFSVSQSLLAFTNPLRATLNQIDKEHKDAVAQANAFNDNVSKVLQEQQARGDALDQIRLNDNYAIGYITKDAAKNNRDLTQSELEHIAALKAEVASADAATASMNEVAKTQDVAFVNLADVNALYLQKRAQAEKDYYAASLGSLQTLINRLRYGDLSGVSLPAALSGAQGTYDAALAKAQSDASSTNVAAVTAAGEALSQLLRQNLTSSEAFYTKNDKIASDMEKLAAFIQGGIESVPAASNGNAPVGISGDLAAFIAYQQEKDKITAAQAAETAAELKLLREMFAKVVNGQ